MEIIVLTGIPAAGKSTLTQRIQCSGHVRVNLDSLNGNRNREDELIAECLKAGRSFVVDNTNTTVERRKKYIDIAKKHGIKVISYYIECDAKTAIERDKLREKKVGRIAIYTMAKYYVRPSKSEGFDEVHRVVNNGVDFQFEED